MKLKLRDVRYMLTIPLFIALFAILYMSAHSQAASGIENDNHEVRAVIPAAPALADQTITPVSDFATDVSSVQVSLIDSTMLPTASKDTSSISRLPVLNASAFDKAVGWDLIDITVITDKEGEGSQNTESDDQSQDHPASDGHIGSYIRDYFGDYDIINASIVCRFDLFPVVSLPEDDLAEETEDFEQIDDAVEIPGLFNDSDSSTESIILPPATVSIINEDIVARHATSPPMHLPNADTANPGTRSRFPATGIVNSNIHSQGDDRATGTLDRSPSMDVSDAILEPANPIAFPMFSRIADPMANSSIRVGILNYIRENPGEHVNKIKRKLNISSSSVVHHLRILEKRDLIIVHQDGRYKRYFANENGYRSSIDSEYKSIFSVLKNGNSLNVVLFLMSNPRSTLSDISRDLNMHPSTVHWHADRLEQSCIISKLRDGKNVRYFVVQAEKVERVISILNAGPAL